MEIVKGQIRLKPINKDNVKVAAKMQYEIFPHSASYVKYLEEVENIKCTYKDFVISLGEDLIGIIGYYTDNYEKNTAWLSWFGLLKAYRKKGYGKKSLDLLLDILKCKGFKTLRLFTYEIWNCEAQNFYKKYMDFGEYYTNKEDSQYDIVNGKCKIFTKSLTEHKSLPWNNKFINIGEEDSLCEQSIKKLKEDKLV